VSTSAAALAYPTLTDAALAYAALAYAAFDSAAFNLRCKSDIFSHWKAAWCFSSVYLSKPRIASYDLI
jgi:hypothetical protein